MRKLVLGLLLCFMALVASGCVSIPTGDGGSLKLSKDGVTIKDADGEQTKINIDKSNEGLTITGTGADGKESTLSVDTTEGGLSFSGTDDDGKAIDVKVSLGNEIPEGFPKEIPIPDDVEIKMGTVADTDNGRMYIVGYSAMGKVIDYYNLYRGYIDDAGYTDVTDASEGKADADTQLENIMVKFDDGGSLAIGIMVSGTGIYDKGEVSVNIMYRE